MSILSSFHMFTVIVPIISCLLFNSCSDRCDLNTSPALFYPSSLVLNGRNTILVENCKLNRYRITKEANVFIQQLLDKIGKQIYLHVFPDLFLSCAFQISISIWKPPKSLIIIELSVYCACPLFCRPKVNYPTYNLLTVKDNNNGELIWAWICAAVVRF